jgi:MoaA/NifB/PqqE/SkfB family radical SAM enzyme
MTARTFSKAGWFWPQRREAVSFVRPPLAALPGQPGMAARSVAWAPEAEPAVADPTGMDASRWSNTLALDGDFAAGQARLSATPLEAYIEVSARCNLRCQMCPITVDPRYDPHSGRPPLLTADLFARLEPLFPTLKRVYLFGLGEPFLHRELIPWVRRLAGAGIEVWVTTNATLIRDEQAEALAVAGLARVTVSIDGATAPTYERIRVRAKFADLMRGLRALGAARRRHGRPKLYFNFIAMAGNLHELPRLVELCAEIGGDGLHVEGLYDWPMLEEFSRQENLGHLDPRRVEDLVAAGRELAAGYGLEWYSRLDELAVFEDGVRAAEFTAGADHAAAEATVASATAHARSPAASPAATVAPMAPLEPLAPIVPAPEIEPAAEANDLVLPWACSEPWTTINVNASGEVRTCCFNNEIFGNLNEQTFDAVWNSTGYRALRAAHVALQVPDSCAVCVRNGRVKRHAFIAPRRSPEEPAVAERRIRLLTPEDGELINGPLVVVGTLPVPDRRRSGSAAGRQLPSGAAGGRRELPELWLDGVRLACLSDYALFDDDRFAAVLAIPWVTPGSYTVSLALPGEPGVPATTWEARRIQVGRLAGDAADPTRYASHQVPPPPPTLAAAARLAFAVPLARRETRPTLLLRGMRQPLAEWLCLWQGTTWLGIAVADVRGVAPGSYPLVLRLRHQPPFERPFERLG